MKYHQIRVTGLLVVLFLIIFICTHLLFGTVKVKNKCDRYDFTATWGFFWLVFVVERSF